MDTILMNPYYEIEKVLTRIIYIALTFELILKKINFKHVW